MGYQIRRLVVPCIIFNVRYALVDHRLFSKLLRIVTVLWKKWRHHLRIEFALICEQLLIKVIAIVRYNTPLSLYLSISLSLPYLSIPLSLPYAPMPLSPYPPIPLSPPKVLQASAVQIRPIFQMLIVQEVGKWFDQPHLLVEMFVNYDMDRYGGSVLYRGFVVCV